MTKAEIQAIQALHTNSGRNQARLFICEGSKLVDEIVKSSLVVKHIYSTVTWHDAETISENEMSRISALKTPTKVLAVVQIPRRQSTDDGLNLVLDGVQDPGNLGTIIRLADWFGISTIYCSRNSVDCFSPKVVQATMGAIARVSVVYTDLIELLSASEMPIYGTFLEGENIYEASLTNHGFVVMGSEGRGVSPEVAALVSSKLYIPPYPASEPSSESLNVAIATAIICSEFRRQSIVK